MPIEILAATGGRGVDLVLNSLSGELIGASFLAIAAGGTFLEIGKNAIWSDARVAALGRDLRYYVIDWGQTAREDPGLISSVFREVMTLVGEGALPPLPYRTFEWRDVENAFRLMAQGRHVGKLVIRQPAPRAGLVRADASYLVTGGLSGLGLLTAEWLASKGARHLVLLGRRAASDDAAQAIERLRQQDVTVSVAAADVSDSRALAAVLDAVRRVGPPLGGVVHAAGALADAALTRQSWTQFADVFRAKVAGTALLDALTRDDPLDFFALYSSIGGVFGAPGQANHAAATAFEDALASARRHEGRPATSIAWGAWGNVGAGFQHRVGDRDATGLRYMAPERALVALERSLQSGHGHPIVCAIDWKAFSAASPVRATRLVSDLVQKTVASAMPSQEVPVQAGPTFLETYAAAPPNRRFRILTEYVRSEAMRVLGLPASDRIDDREALQERGLDSLMAVELRNVIARGLDRSLPATLLFDYPTLEALTRHLETLLAPADDRAEPVTVEAAPARPVEPRITPTASVLDAIDDLSDEDVDRLLAERMGKKN